MTEIYLGNFVQELVDLNAFVSCSLDGHSYATGAGKVADFIHKVATTGGTYHPLADDIYYENEKGRIAKLEAFAKNELENQHPFLFSLAVIKLWTIIEAGANHVIYELIKDSGRLLASPKIVAMKGPLIPFLAFSEIERAHYLKEKLFQEVGSANRMGVHKFEVVLEELQLPGSVKDPVRKVLLELCEKRNVLVHKCGVVDNRFKEKCPWIHVAVGDKICPTYADYRLYSDASLWYLIDISLRMSVAQTATISDKDEFVAFLAELETSVQQAVDARET